MKIAHVVWGMTTGGIETMLVNIANVQVALGHDVSIVVVNDMFDDGVMSRLSPSVKVRRVGRPVGHASLPYALKLAMTLRRIDPDVIHAHHWRLGYLLPFSLYHRRVVLTFHDSVPDADRRYPTLPYFSRIYAISHYVHDDLRSKLGRDSIVVTNGIDAGLFTQSQNLWTPGCGETLKIVQVGRFDMYKKGHDLLIEAASILRKRGVGGFEIHLIGDGDDEPVLRRLVADRGVVDIVVFEGNKSQEFVFKHLADYNMLVQPSRFDGFGLTVAEAMAARVPVMVSGCDGPMEIIDDGRYGLRFVSGDASALAEVILHVLECGFDAAMVDDAVKRVHDLYDIRRTAMKYLDEYAKL